MWGKAYQLYLDNVLDIEGCHFKTWEHLKYKGMSIREIYEELVVEDLLAKEALRKEIGPKRDLT